MRTLLVIAVLVLILVFAGWLRYSAPGGNPTIEVDTDKVKQDTSTMVEKTKEAVGNVVEETDDRLNGEPVIEN